MKNFGWAIIAAMFCATGASAQGRSGMSTSSPLTNVRPYVELQGFGECLARTQRKQALALIATAPDSADEDKLLKKYVYGEHSTCMFGGTEMAMPNLFARGVIAEGLLKNEGVPEAYRLTSPLPAEVRDLHGVARCYTSGHRGEVAQLLKTQPGSREEVQAVAALWEGFRTCMPNFKVRLNAPWIRFLLAQALLRLPPEAAAEVR
jgi:hypothetical protein